MGLTNIYYLLQDMADRNRAATQREQEGAAANWLTNFAAADGPDTRDLRMSQLGSVVSDPVIREKTRVAADTEMLKRFQNDAASLYAPSMIRGQEGRVPSPHEARTDLMALARDERVPAHIALPTAANLESLAMSPIPKPVKVSDELTRLYTEDGRYTEATDREKDKSPYKVGKRETYIGPGGHTYEGTFQGLSPDNEPIWGNSVKKYEKPTGSSSTDGGAGLASNARMVRTEAVKTAQARLYAVARELDPEISELDNMLGDVDANVKYASVRARMAKPVQLVFDKLTQRVGELALTNGGDFEAANNTAFAEMSDEIYAAAGKAKKTSAGDIATKFKKDPEMKNYKLGGYVAGEGYQVFDKAGQLVGYYEDDE